MTHRRTRRLKAEPKTDHAFAHLGRHLLAARNACGLSQQDLAARCGLDQAHISRFEKGERQPTLRQLAGLAAALAVPFQWFINGSERPGNGYREIAVELHRLGISDLALGGAVVPGACRPVEEVLALAVSGDRVDPRVLEALPAVLAWNAWDPGVLEAYGRSEDPRAAHRLAWLAEIAWTIHISTGFPGGTRNALRFEALTRAVRPPDVPDGLGFPTLDDSLPPVSRRWNVTYAADLEAFYQRARHLLSMWADQPNRWHWLPE
ncbi:MAG TPA: helix-turn-helix domain-containing protein [Gemmataceae bacterium]|nr:helix-turn-helix domain-containing protein [Gemmataceae bacterium]